MAIASAWIFTACSSSSDTVPSAVTESNPGPVSGTSLIQLVDALDEPEYYCIDVPGAANTVMLQAALQAHTCKLQGQEDELFTAAHPAAGPLYMPAYDMCVQADSNQSGSQLHLETCSDSPLQVFEYAADQSLQLVEETQTLCVAVEAAPGQPTDGPSHLRLDLFLQSCEDTASNLRRWLLPGLEPQ